jgi:hypothetical protein
LNVEVQKLDARYQYEQYRRDDINPKSAVFKFYVTVNVASQGSSIHNDCEADEQSGIAATRIVIVFLNPLNSP